MTTKEGLSLIDQIISFGKPPPLLVMTGGDPMWRRDLEVLVRYASERGVSVALIPSGTAAARHDRLAALQRAGLTRVAVSLDGPDPTSHDDFRRVRGSFKWTMRIIESAIALGMPLQVNSTVTRRTLPLFEQMVETVCGLPLALWAVFFLVPTGRGVDVDQIEPAECEWVLQRLCELTRVVPFGIKTTEAPHFRRVMAEQAKGGSGRRVPGRLPPRLPCAASTMATALCSSTTAVRSIRVGSCRSHSATLVTVRSCRPIATTPRSSACEIQRP